MLADMHKICIGKQIKFLNIRIQKRKNGKNKIFFNKV